MNLKETLFTVPTTWRAWSIQMVLAAVLVGIYMMIRPVRVMLAVVIFAIGAAASAAWVAFSNNKREK